MVDSTDVASLVEEAKNKDKDRVEDVEDADADDVGEPDVDATNGTNGASLFFF